MSDTDKTREQLLVELTTLRHQLTELEASVQTMQVREQHYQVTAQQLRESEQRYRTLVEESLQGLSIVTKDYRRVFANQALVTMLGYEHPDDLIGMHAWDGIVPESLAEVRRYGEARRGGEAVPAWYTYQRQKRDGTPIWIEQRLTPIPWEGETAYLTTMVDVSERKQAEEALQRASEEALRRERDFSSSLIQAVPTFFVVIDSAGSVQQINEMMLRALDYTLEEVQGADYITLCIPEADQARMRSMFASRFLGHRAAGSTTNQVLTKSGRVLLVEWHGGKIIDGNGDEYLYAMGVDITERRHAEEQIARHNHALEQAVQDTTRDMEALMDRIVRQEKLATIGQISGSIAHELRNPLGAVKQSLFFLNRLYHTQRMDPSNPKVREHLQLIDAEIDAANRVITQLLAVARTHPQQPELVNLQLLIHESLQSEKWWEDMHLTYLCNPDPFEFWADRWHMQHVFINLLSNAADACAHKGRVTIRAHVDVMAQQYEMTVQDTGCGIPADELPHVFEPLYTRKTWGTGLGLSLCQQLMHQQGGTITMHSQVGQGTTVLLRLPLPSAPDAAVPPTRAPSSDKRFST